MPMLSSSGSLLDIRRCPPTMWHPLAVPLGADVQNFLECLLEVLVAQGVDEGVQRGVDVAQPDGEHVHGFAAAAVAEGNDHEEDEIGNPAEDEGRHDKAQLFGRLPLSVQVQPRHILSGM